jgi:hypothetical protein
MTEHEHHHHEHNEACTCGHDHAHEHVHDESCSCGHDHHVHDESCTCGHDHAHEHVHDESCSCGHDHHVHDESCTCGHEEHDSGEIHIECRLHDEARVISGRLTITGSYNKVKEAVSSALERVAKAVQEHDGIVGHVKASCEVKTVEMFSVTDTDVSVKTAPDQEIKINMAAIVFLIDPEDAEDLVRLALEIIRDSALG